MRHAVRFAPEALDDLKRLRKSEATGFIDAIEIYLRSEPTRVSKSRIKRLREIRSPQYRLRVGEIRAFYDVVEDEVWIRGVVKKADANRWLAEFGEVS